MACTNMDDPDLFNAVTIGQMDQLPTHPIAAINSLQQRQTNPGTSNQIFQMPTTNNNNSAHIDAVVLNLQVQDVVKLVDTLYHSNNSQAQAEADRILIAFQASDRLLQLIWPLLDPTPFKSADVQFFAANALLLKLKHNWAQLSQEWLENEFKPKLFQVLLNYTSSPYGSKAVIDRLALILATFALHSIPTFWPTAIEEMMQLFKHENLPPTIAFQKICEILLRILCYIPEEYANHLTQQEQRAKLNFHVTEAAPKVFTYLNSLLKDSFTPMECRQSALKCLATWSTNSNTSLLTVDDSSLIIDQVYNLIKDEELCSSACATLTVTFGSDKARDYKCSVIEFIPKISKLKQVADKYIADDELECAIKIYSLITTFADTHIDLLLKMVLDDGMEADANVKQDVFTIIKMILECASRPGTFGIEEKFSDLTFSFWFVFFETFERFSSEFTESICTTFDPLVDSLVQVFLNKSQYPPSEVYFRSWNDDQREAFRCYRQDIADIFSILIRFPNSKDRILSGLSSQLVHELPQIQGNHHSQDTWQRLESTLFALKSVSESICLNETLYIPGVFNTISQIEFNESLALLYCTVAEMVSAYSEWLSRHNNHLGVAFRVLFLGINSSSSQIRLISTISLKDLTSECQPVLHSLAQQIAKKCAEVILDSNSNLTTNEKSRLFHSMGTALAVSPNILVIESLNTVASPLINELAATVRTSSSVIPSERAKVIDSVTMLNSLIDSLYIKPELDYDYDEDAEVDDIGEERFQFGYHQSPAEVIRSEDKIQQPALELLKCIVPILELISLRYRCDEEVIDIVRSTIRKSARSLGQDLKPVLEDLLMIIAMTYDPFVNSDILEAIYSLYMLFRLDPDAEPSLKNTFILITSKTLDSIPLDGIRHFSIAIEHYLKYATFVIKKFPDFLNAQPAPFEVKQIYKLAIAGLGMPEKKTLAEASNFISTFKQKAIGVEHLHAIFIENLGALLSKIFNILGDNYSTPRNAFEHIFDLLYTVTDKDARGHMNTFVETDNFPTNSSTRDIKSKFVSKIMHEKNRNKFKAACLNFVNAIRINANSSIVIHSDAY